MSDKTPNVQTQDDENIMKISDLKTAAFIVAKNFNVMGISWEGKRCFFHFKKDKEVENVLTEYRFGEGLIPVKRLYAAQDELKSLLFDA
jgi:hypothetical protein